MKTNENENVFMYNEIKNALVKFGITGINPNELPLNDSYKWLLKKVCLEDVWIVIEQEEHITEMFEQIYIEEFSHLFNGFGLNDLGEYLDPFITFNGGDVLNQLVEHKYFEREYSFLQPKEAINYLLANDPTFRKSVNICERKKIRLNQINSVMLANLLCRSLASDVLMNKLESGVVADFLEKHNGKEVSK